MTNKDDQVLASPDMPKALRLHTSAAYRSINVEIAARGNETERLRATRLQSLPTGQ